MSGKNSFVTFLCLSLPKRITIPQSRRSSQIGNKLVSLAMIHHITAKLEGIRSETDWDSGAALSNKYTNKFATFDQYVTDYYLEIYSHSLGILGLMNTNRKLYTSKQLTDLWCSDDLNWPFKVTHFGYQEPISRRWHRSVTIYSPLCNWLFFSAPKISA